MIGDLPVARDVLQTRSRIRKRRGKEILRLHPRDLRRVFPAAPAPRNCQRDIRVPAPVRAEHRCVEQRLDQDLFDGFRREEAEDRLQWKGMLRAQGEEQRILRGCSLELEIELAAEPLPERQTPRPIYPAAER